MIQTMNPYASSRTAEIMSRYRPIAPKPEASPISPTGENEGGLSEIGENMSVPSSIRKSPYLRNVWAHLQARPTRTRKRGRSSAFPPPPSVKRPRSCLSAPFPASSSPAKNLALHGFSHGFSLVPINCGLDAAVATLADSVARPLGRYATAAEISVIVSEGSKGVIDLNMEAEDGPKELDFMAQLKEPIKPTVITPQPIRPIGSSIIVKSISDGQCREAESLKPAEEAEKEIEEATVPAVISDSNNKVRMVNSAYKEMVGQPECCWLDCVAARGASEHGSASKRIGGEVSLQLGSELGAQITSMNGFSSQVRIEWETQGKKRSVNGVCHVVKMGTNDKNCRFLWRFHSNEAL